MKKNSVLLRQAKQIILEEGWTKGLEGMAPSGPACLLGAIGRAAGVKPPEPQPGWAQYIDMNKVIMLPVVSALTQCIAEVEPEMRANSDTVWRFNDTRAKTQERVVQVLNDCANKEEEAGR